MSSKRDRVVMSSALSPVWCAAWALMSLAGAVQAQGLVPPTTGDVLRSVTPPLAPVPRAPDADAVQRAPAPMAAPSASTVLIHVRGISVTGATVFSQEMLTSLVADLMGKRVTLADLQAAAQRITEQYEAAGYPVARAVLPAQDIVDGVVEFMVLEGRVGKVAIDNRSLIKDGQVQRLLGEIPAGSVVHEPTLERQLLLLGETPGASRAIVTLQPGAALGETDLGIQVEPGPRISGQLDADNHGNRYTGYHRLSSLISLNSPLGLGDRFQVRSLVSDRQLGSLRLDYRVPVGSSGLAVGAAWSDVHYDLAREFGFLDATGWSHVKTVYASYPVLRSVDSNLLATLSYDDKSFKDDIGSVYSNRKSSDVASLSLNAYGTRGPVLYALASVFSHGRLHLRSGADDDAGTRGSFTKLVATGNALWGFAPNWGLYGSLYGQVTSKNLDPSEQLTLGGASGVRAYPQGESSGDEGYIATAELRYTVPLRPVQLAAFVDYGGIRFNHKAYSADRNNRYLQGAGVSATWAPRPDVGLKLMVATRLGDDEVQSEPFDSHTQVWLQGLWRF